MTEKLKGIAGSMFAGKTDSLLKEISDAEYARKKIQVFKPSIDTRWGIDKITSHAGRSHSAIPVENAYGIIENLDPKTKIVAIDEIQFFGEEIIDVVRFLLEEDIRVIFAGLSLDFRGEPFGSMPELLALCDELDRPTAVCRYEEDGETCGQRATRTQRLIKGKNANYDDNIFLIGDSSEYEARCPNHHIVPGKPQPKIKP